MSIVNYVKDKLPECGQVVFCDNGNMSGDRAIYKNGKFFGGGEFPVKSYEMTCVTKWFCFRRYDMAHENEASYFVSFDIAETITPKD